ncbi:hypothetical protein NliqN6_1443 [Naganishia liquefaciens]|uniref:Uncharacterized protein n=1 Tax=Naganishia liquefaciens TaxID=104408 RepID=A0A8H3TQD9_9TREE|nr:hypothetical protein NliqN6_1443 [Naganishia liquefaciens]
MDGAPTVEELSFYDQPDGDALFSTTSHIPREHQLSDDSDEDAGSSRTRRSSSVSSVLSDQSTASTVSAVSAASSTSSCSSLEQVFFGAQTDKEKKLLARLSRQAANLQIRTPPRASQTGGAANTLKKKDSLEFNRRKTLGFSSRRNAIGGQSRRWEGGLIESTNLSNTRTPLRNTMKASSISGSPEDFLRTLTTPVACAAGTPPIKNIVIAHSDEELEGGEIYKPEFSTRSTTWSPGASVRNMAESSSHDSAFLAEDLSSGIF